MPHQKYEKLSEWTISRIDIIFVSTRQCMANLHNGSTCTQLFDMTKRLTHARKWVSRMGFQECLKNQSNTSRAVEYACMYLQSPFEYQWHHFYNSVFLSWRVPEADPSGNSVILDTSEFRRLKVSILSYTFSFSWLEDQADYYRDVFAKYVCLPMFTGSFNRA